MCYHVFKETVSQFSPQILPIFIGFASVFKFSFRFKRSEISLDNLNLNRSVCRY